MKYFMAKKRYYILKLEYDAQITERSDFLKMIIKQGQKLKNRKK